VATTSIKRIFSAMSFVKTDLRNKMSDEWLNDLMIWYTEKEIFRSIKNDKIIKRFEDMKTWRMLVPQNNLVV
jgi:TRAP-type C4-dicarboxylate transport system substrate-binding protein